MAVAGGAVGPILAGAIGGTATLTVEQAVVIDKEQFDNQDFTGSLPDKLIAVNDDGTSFTAAVEHHVGSVMVMDVPLLNLSNEDANAIITVDTDPQLDRGIEVFWNTINRSASPATSNTTPSPAPVTSTSAQSSNTQAATTAPTGTAGINPQVSNGVPTNTFPGMPTPTPQVEDDAFTTTKPTGLSDNTAQNSTSTATNDPAEVSGSAPISPQNANATPQTSQPSGLTGVVQSRSVSFTGTTTAPSGSPSIIKQTAATTTTTTKPDADLPGG